MFDVLHEDEDQIEAIKKFCKVQKQESIATLMLFPLINGITR